MNAYARARTALVRLRAASGPSPRLAAGVVVGLVSLAGSCRSVPRQPAPPPRPVAVPPAAVLEAGLAPPIIRVGILVEVERVSIGADRGLAVRESAPHGPRHRVTFLPAGAGQPAVFRVQVASFTSEAAAQEAAQRAKAASGTEPEVRFNDQTRTHQVRLGEFATREEAEALAVRLEAAGVPGGWVVEQPAVGSGRIRLLETGEEMEAATVAALGPGDLLTADAAPYRGFLQVRGNPGGTLTVVNVLNLEDYVRGVVPNELSPSAFPELEAVKAQAVAARTYALRNMGQFAARGYDICATPACQLYRGKASEQEMSDRAVEETRGVVATHGGSLINSLYTSTCGGHTEDVENIFEGEGSPYLKGVVCLPERAAFATLRTAAPSPAGFEERERLPRDAALLQALRVLEDVSPAALSGFATGQEARAWVKRLVEALGRKACPGARDGDAGRRGTFFRHLVGSICWDERAQRLLGPSDPAYLLKLEDRDALAGDAERLAAALLIQEGILTPFPNNTLRPEAAIARADAVQLLAETAVKAGAPGLVSAVFREAGAGGLVVERDGAREPLALDGKARLFRALNGSRLAASELDLVSGDAVRYVARDGRIVFLEADQSRLGPSADHASRMYRWEVRMTPEEVARAAARYGSVGALRDLKPLRLGVSGRVVELALVGSEGELLLKGLKVRWGLGLRENLFVVTRELDDTGGVARFVFTGKGWGHGVGLCQVGAFGMARSGSTYERILKHYYKGISLQQR